MRRIVVGERDIVVLEQAQRDVLAIRLAVRTVVDIRYDKYVNIYFILQQFTAFET